jgi:hypothetical protein
MSLRRAVVGSLHRLGGKRWRRKRPSRSVIPVSFQPGPITRLRDRLFYSLWRLCKRAVIVPPPSGSGRFVLEELRMVDGDAY